MSKKRLLIVMIAIVAGILPFSVSAAPLFVNDLQVGSSNPEVYELQKILIASGFDIPAISSGAAQKGTFGSQTKAAVQKYQKSLGVPSTGFVGPLTRAKLNGKLGVVTTPVVVANPGSITTPGVAGSLAFTLQGSPSGASLDKGETEEVARYKLQATASDMQVSSIALDFDVRLWLYASSITIKDDAGAVIAQKNNLSVNDFTELTVGSSYRLYVPVSYVVPKTQSRYFTVSVSILPVTDRTTGTLTITSAQVRSVDGTGVTDTQTEATDRTFSFTASNGGAIVITANEQTPPNMLVPIAVGSETENIVLGVANFKSQNKDGLMRSVSLYLSTNGIAPASLFNSVKIKAGDLIYNADSIANGNLGDLTTFSNLKIPLPKDQNVPIAILVTVKKNTNNALDGSMASSTLLAAGTAGGTSNNPVVEDDTLHTMDINDAPIVTSDISFASSDANLFSAAPTTILGGYTLGNVGGVGIPVTQTVTFNYTLTAGDNTLYVSANPVNALATTSTGYSTTNTASSSITIVTANPSEIAGDAAGSYYVIPAGSSRAFRWVGTMKNEAATGPTLRTFSITGIRYGTTSSALTANTVVYYDYGALKALTTI